MFLPIREGAVIGERYRIAKVLGKGRVGPVALAIDLHLDQTVVVRVLRPELAESEEHVERFLQEARRARKIESPNVARVQDVGRIEAGAPYLVTEYLEGQDLATLCLERGGLPVPEAVDYVVEACRGLSDAHTMGLVHGDLGPASLFLAERVGAPSSVKIVDFGLARMVIATAIREGVDEATAVQGSPSKRSGDLAPASRAVDVRPDLRAMARTLAQLVAGDVEWKDESLRDRETPLPPISRREAALPEALRSVLARCSEVDPATRFRTAVELADALRPLGRGPSASLLDDDEERTDVDQSQHGLT